MTSERTVSDYFKGTYWAVSAAIACLGWAAAQSMAPDEMRAHTVPYVPPPPVTLRTEVDLVEVPVVVRDGQHRAVAGLTKDDFEIYDAGKKQTITAFSEQHFTLPVDAGDGAKPAVVPAAPAGPKGEPRPRFVALCFDDLNMDPLALKPVEGRLHGLHDSRSASRNLRGARRSRGCPGRQADGGKRSRRNQSAC